MSLAEMLTFVITLLVAAVAIALSLWALRRAARMVPLRRAQQATLRRALPVLEIAVVLAILVAALLFALGQRPVLALGIMAAAMLALGAAAWFVIRDWVSGAVLRAEDAYDAGQWIRVDDVQGRIVRAGARSIEIETAHGERARLPYSRLAGATLRRAGPVDASRAHAFTVAAPLGLGVPDALARLRAAALNSFYASAAREPFITPAGRQGDAFLFEVTVYAAEPVYFPAIEQTVRDAVHGD